MLTLRAYRTPDAKTIAPWVREKTVFDWWSAGKLGEYPLAPQTLDAYYAQGGSAGEWFPRVLEEDGEAVGSMLMRWEDKAQGEMRFALIIVNPDARGKGHGGAMLVMAMEYAFHLKGAQRVTIAVFADNQPAIRCYERLGFVRAKEITLPDGQGERAAYLYEKKRAGM